MSSELLKVFHIVGISLIAIGLAALWGSSARTGGKLDRKVRIQLALVHGFGMTIAILSGFMLLAGAEMGGWVYAKLFVWLLLGGSMILAKRKADWGAGLLLLWAALIGVAAWFAFFKPF